MYDFTNSFPFVHTLFNVLRATITNLLREKLFVCEFTKDGGDIECVQVKTLVACNLLHLHSKARACNLLHLRSRARAYYLLQLRSRARAYNLLQ
jgi:hypothetical protein